MYRPGSVTRPTYGQVILLTDGAGSVCHWYLPRLRASLLASSEREAPEAASSRAKQSSSTFLVLRGLRCTRPGTSGEIRAIACSARVDAAAPSGGMAVTRAAGGMPVAVMVQVRALASNSLLKTKATPSNGHS